MSIVFSDNFDTDTAGNGNIPAGWNSYNSAGTQTYKGVANDFSFSSPNSYKISATSNTDTGISKLFTGLTIGARYTLTASMKTDASCNAASIVLVTFGGGSVAENTIGANFSGGINISTIVDSHGELSIFLSLGSYGPQSVGTVWYDDISFTDPDGFNIALIKFP